MNTIHIIPKPENKFVGKIKSTLYPSDWKKDNDIYKLTIDAPEYNSKDHYACILPDFNNTTNKEIDYIAKSKIEVVGLDGKILFINRGKKPKCDIHIVIEYRDKRSLDEDTL